MPIKLRTVTLALILTGIITTPVLAVTSTDDSAAMLLRGAKKWVSKDRPDLAENLLHKLILIEPNSEEGLFMLGNLELRNAHPELALRYLHTLQKIAPNSARSKELADSCRLATSDKPTLDKIRALAQSGKNAEAERQMKQLFPGKPPKGDLALEYYRIVGNSKDGFNAAQDDLAALYKETGDPRYRLLQLELQGGQPKLLASAIRGYEELSTHPAINLDSLHDSWRKDLYKYPDTPDKQTAIKNFLSRYPHDQAMLQLQDDVQKNLAGQSLIAKPASTPLNAIASKNAEPPKEAKAAHTASKKHPPVALVAAAASAEPAPPAAEPPAPPVDPDIVARTDALDALADGNTQVAEPALTDILKRRPQDPEVLGGLGLVKQKQGKFSEAEIWFKQALTAAQSAKVETARWETLIDVARFSQHMKQAKSLLEDNQLAAAEEEINQARALRPDDPDVRAVLGDIRYAQNNPVEAEQLYREALQIEGYNVFATRGLATLLAQTQRSEAALALIDHALATYPNEWKKSPYGHAALLREAANLHLAAHRPGNAIKALETAVTVDPGNPWVRFSLAKLYISLNLTPLARRVMQEGVALQPHDANMLYTQALVSLSLDDYASGLNSLAQIPEAELTPSMRDARNRALMQVYFQQAEDKLAQGNRKEALRIMSIAETQARGNFAATEQVANGWFKLGLQKQGLSAMQRLPQPRPLRTQMLYASLLNRAKKDQELSEYLPSIVIPEGADETNKEYRLSIREIEFAMAGRQFDKLRAAGKTAAAQQLADAVMNANRLDSTEYFRVHHSYFAKAELPPDAISQLVQEKELHPNDLNVRWDLAYAYNQAGQNDAARHEAEELLGMLKDDDVDMQLRVAKLQHDIGDTEGSHQTLDTLVERHPHNNEVLLQAGYTAKSEGQYNQAMRYFQQSKQLAPQAVANPNPSSTTVAANATAPDILLNLIPSKQLQNDPAPRIVAPLTDSKESTQIYRNALASDVPQEQYIANRVGTEADQAMASIVTRRTAQVEAGLDIQSKNSSNGTSSYHATEIPVLARFPIGYEAHGSVQIDSVNVDAGILPTTFADAALFGKIQAYQYVPPITNLTPAASGTSVALGYEQGSVKTDIGMVGIGFPVSNLVGGIRQYGKIEELDYAVNLSRRPMTGSLLSYAGAKDPVTGDIWGGVTNTSAALSLSSTVSDFNLSTNASYGLLRGKNVLNNDRLYLRAGVDEDVYTRKNTVLNAGLNLTYMSYANNQSYYTFGHGGYYSPRSSLSWGLPLTVSGRADKLVYQLRANLTYATTATDSAPFYPTDPALQARAPAGVMPSGYTQLIYPGSNGGGTGYGLRATAEYRSTPQLAIGTRFNMERSAYYAPNSLLFYVRYLFQPETGAAKMSPDVVTPYSQF